MIQIPTQDYESNNIIENVIPKENMWFNTSNVPFGIWLNYKKIDDAPEKYKIHWNICAEIKEKNSDMPKIKSFFTFDDFWIVDFLKVFTWRKFYIQKNCQVWR